jgi:TPR repeat protein
MYFDGEGVTRDYAEAAKWYLKSADNGNVTAMYNIGNCYAFGEGVQENAYEAFFWYSLAASSGDEDAIRARDILSRQFSKQDLNNLLKRAELWFYKHYSD